MTKEEAIDIIKYLAWHRRPDEEDVKQAIKVLEQKSCEDVISCEAVIEWLKTKDIIKLSSQEDTARKELKALLSAKSQPKTEHWSNIPNYDSAWYRV